MIKKVINIFFISSFLIFIIFLVIFYFSDDNVNLTNKSRNDYAIIKKNSTLNLPLLKNDTNKIIEYKDDIEAFQKNKKNYKFWDLIKK